jgi:hypothetical protein
MNDSQTKNFAPKLPADDPNYRERVAVPIMQAVDAMPMEWRTLVHEYGYVDVYRAWKRGWSVELVRRSAEANGGAFVL